jgi:hypothetical protein
MNCAEFAYEKEMREPVARWLESNGFVSTREMYHHRPIDIVAGRFAERVNRRIPPLLETLAIELKLSNAAAVLRQATGNRDAVDRSYAAMPLSRCARLAEKTRLGFLIEGVGLLAVDKATVTEVIPARRSAAGTQEHIRRNLWRKCQREGAVG